MKRIIMSMLALTILACTNLSADFQGPGAVDKKNITTVAEAKQSPEHTKVILTGSIISKIKKEHYVFKDKSGEMNVEIDDDQLKGITVTPETNITIYGDVDNDSPKGIDVDRIQVNSAQRNLSKQSSKSIPLPSGATEVSSGTDRGCTYTRYSINQSPLAVINYYDSQFKSNGWKVTSKGGGGSSYGGGASITANKSGRYVRVDGGGGGAETFFNLILGSNKNDVDHCRIRE